MQIEDKLKKKIYSVLDYKDYYDNGFIKNVYCPKYNKDSNNSFMFSKNKIDGKSDEDSSDDKRELLIEIFEINNIETFNKKYKEAVSGSGNEYRRITTLTSSSLCALLCFYNVNSNNKIKINKIEYDDVCFEVKNTVFDPRHPSNMDVVLISHSSKKLLFLESKFSEYLCHSSKVNKISNKYFECYQNLGLFEGDYKYSNKNEYTFDFELKDKKNAFYIEGIKQMISHYIGINNFIKNGNKELNNRLKSDYKDYQVILGEIIFNAWDEDYFNKYSKAYSKLIDKFKKHNKNNPEFIDKPLEYVEVFKDYNVDEKVRKFYFSKNK